MPCARQVLDPAFDVRSLEQAVFEMPALHGERRVEAHAGTRLAQQLVDSCAGLRCAWWCEGAVGVGDFVVARALPADAAFDALWRSGPQGD